MNPCVTCWSEVAQPRDWEPPGVIGNEREKDSSDSEVSSPSSEPSDAQDDLVTISDTEPEEEEDETDLTQENAGTRTTRGRTVTPEC